MANPQQAIQKAQPTLEQFLKIRQAHLEEVLPKSKGLTAEKLIKLAILASSRQPKLKECSMASIFLALLQCAELGLEPSGTMGSAYLVPYKGECKLIIGYRGLIDLARRSGALRQIEAHVVHEKDSFKLRFGLDPKLEHEPYLEGDPGKPRLVYVVAQLEGDARHVEVMTIAEVNAIRKRSKSANDGPWETDYEEMAKKTVARRACKWLPLSADLAHALSSEDDDSPMHTTRGPEASDVLGAAPAQHALSAQTQTANVKQLLKSKKQPAIVDVQIGETEQQALERVAKAAQAEEPERDPNTGQVVPDFVGQEPPPPSDADMPFGGAA